VAAAGQGLRLVQHARYYWSLKAESRLTRRLFGTVLEEDYYLTLASGVGEPQT